MGDTGIEPVAFSMSTKRSTTELIARQMAGESVRNAPTSGKTYSHKLIAYLPIAVFGAHGWNRTSEPFAYKANALTD